MLLPGFGKSLIYQYRLPRRPKRLPSCTSRFYCAWLVPSKQIRCSSFFEHLEVSVDINSNRLVVQAITFIWFCSGTGCFLLLFSIMSLHLMIYSALINALEFSYCFVQSARVINGFHHILLLVKYVSNNKFKLLFCILQPIAIE